MPAAAPPEPRGVPLADLVIARIAAGRGAVRVWEPRPVPQALLDGLTLPGGFPLPPALHRLLGWDASWVMRELGWFHAPGRPSFPALPFPELVAARLGPGLVERALPGLFVPLAVGPRALDLLHLGHPD